MSDSRHAENIVKAFRREYPAAAGWKILDLFPDKSPTPSTAIAKLPEYLRDIKPEYLKSADFSDIGHILLKHRNEFAEKLPVEEWETKLDPETWTGEIQVSFGGELIVYRSLPLYSSNTWGTIAMAAYKDQGAIDRFHTEVAKWHYSKKKTKNAINVIGGHGMPQAIPRPKLTWDDIILPGTLSRDISANVTGFFKAGDRYKQLGLPHKRGFLLSGPPGNGKTLAAKIIASDNALNFT